MCNYPPYSLEWRISTANYFKSRLIFNLNFVTTSLHVTKEFISLWTGKGHNEAEIYTHRYSILKDLKIAFSQLLAIRTRHTSLLWHSFLIILYTFDEGQGTAPSSLQSIHEQLHSMYFTDVRWILPLSSSKHLSSKTGLFPQTSAECLSRPKAVTRKRTKWFHKSFWYSDIFSYYGAKYTIYDTLPRSYTALPGPCSQFGSAT